MKVKAEKPVPVEAARPRAKTPPAGVDRTKRWKLANADRCREYNRVYMRDYMRRRRAAERERKDLAFGPVQVN